jgi:hypothetical protein
MKIDEGLAKPLVTNGKSTSVVKELALMVAPEAYTAVAITTVNTHLFIRYGRNCLRKMI